MTRKDRSRRWLHALWLGPVVTVAATISYFEVFARFPALRDFPWVNLPLSIVGMALSGIGLVRAFSPGNRWWLRVAASLGLALSLLAGGFLVLYVFRLSYDLPTASQTAARLEVAPDFELPDADGVMHRPGQYRGSRVVIVFYRGHW